MRKAHEELVEECARAAIDANEHISSKAWDDLPDAVKDFWREIQRAVLTVVWRRAQEVTPEMLDAWIEGEDWDATGVYLSMLRAGPLNPEGE